jgi:hypothetical protein
MKKQEALEVWHSWKNCKWLESKHSKKEKMQLGILEKLVNDQKTNIWKKKTSIGCFCSLSDQRTKLRTINQPRHSWKTCKWLESKRKKKEYDQKVLSCHKSSTCEFKLTTERRGLEICERTWKWKQREKNLTYLSTHTESCWMHLEKLMQGTWNKNGQKFSLLEILRSSKMCCSSSTIQSKTLSLSKHTSTH